jgi:murein DD-endopeptidase MepM/ murein hydrolase activator NlpD
MRAAKTEKKVKWTQKWRNKYRLVFMTDDTLEERFTFRLSRMNVFIASGTLAIILIFLTSILIAFTPLREYIPGYTNVGLTKRLYRLQIRTDSIERDLVRKEQFLNSIKDIINGRNLPAEQPLAKDTMRRYRDVKLKRSPEDSLLRLEVENQTKYSLYKIENKEGSTLKKPNIGGMVFFTPVKGIVTNKFDPARNHFGIDIVSKQNEAVKAVLDGTVLLAVWTVETGYVIMVSHPGNVVSAYKHNSALLKKSGDFVNAGEPIAIIGQTGELANGPHLHFELWNDGNPVNPQDYIKF